NGVDIFANIVDTRTKVGLVFQDPDSQFVGQTVKEDIAFGPENLQLAEAVVEERVAQAMETVGLTDYAERRPYQLSGGEKRRLAIAGVLAMHPEIIVFDEPFTGLDYDGVVQVLEAVLQLQAMQKTIIVVTHDLGKIMAHADRLVVMNKGEIVLDGTPIEMINEVENYGIKIPHGIEHDLKTMTWLK
ncbi:MAG: energy-coupling factor ABC transporter ATP-binding protein, partial [Saprospiraceae bacterium]